MKAVLLYGERDLRVGALPDPVPGPGELLLRVLAPPKHSLGSPTVIAEARR